MKKLTEILQDVFVIEFENECFNFKIERFQNKYFHINYDLSSNEFVTRSGGIALMYKDFGGRKKYPEQLELLGTITKDEISFDVEPYIHKYSENLYRDYAVESDYAVICTTGKEQSFRSLLLKHGLYWVNPEGVVPRKQVYANSPAEQDYMDKNINADVIKTWRQREANKLTGKLVVLKKVK